MQATFLDNRLRAAEAVVRDAGRLATDHFARRAMLSIDRKGAQDLVSEADRECEDLIVSGLSRRFPADGFLGEEHGFRNPDTPAVWVIDPIDGTHNFLTGIPFWCVSVGFVVDGELALGIIYNQGAAELFSARKGGGAFLNDRPIKVSGETNATRARVSLGFSYRRLVGGARARSMRCFRPVANICGSAPGRSASPTRPRDASRVTGSATSMRGMPSRDCSWSAKPGLDE
jgi:myo-inositol-1(or 4)-monophosphatase